MQVVSHVSLAHTGKALQQKRLPVEEKAFDFPRTLLREPMVNVKNGGAMESRTPDLLHAMQALYQLSYDPKSGTNLI